MRNKEGCSLFLSNIKQQQRPVEEAAAIETGMEQVS